MSARFAIWLLGISVAAPGGAGGAETLPYWPAEQRPVQREYEALLDSLPDPGRLADWHAQFTAEPHLAGSEGDRRLIERLAGAFREMGLETEVHGFTAWLPVLGEAEVEIIAAPAGDDPLAGAYAAIDGEQPLSLPLQEAPLEEDPFTSHPELGIGWNGYSGSGEVTAGVVYANRGTREDFEKLRQLGVTVRGRIVLARYGGNFRGHKVTFAEQAGAAGLILFTDPSDSGYGRGPTYPEGGWANPTYIQRGSIKNLAYPGDPLTPFVAADADAERLDPREVALPGIPVQPLGWRAAWEILRRMRGEPVPDGWQGGLPVAYRLQGGVELEVRLRVEQGRELRQTANVVGVLRGSVHPDQLVIVGCHHDAWTFGAVDPNAGSMVVVEAARVFAEAAKQGRPPARSVVFAHWGAEEQGIIGSVEWVERHRDKLLENAVAYINLDSAVTGPRFGSSAAPSLKRLIEEVARTVEHPAAEHETVFDQWTASGTDEPSFGNLGGGSDHVGFYCHVGVPSCGVGAGGSPGTSYHSNYDTLTWYRRVVGDDYEPARMVTRVVNRLVARLANAPLLPLDPVRYAIDARQHLEELERRAEERKVAIDLAPLETAIDRYQAVAEPTWQRLLAAVGEDLLSGERLARVNGVLLRLERVWLHPAGLPERPWFRNLYAATDPDSGYAAWMLPALRWGVERRRDRELERLVPLYIAAFRSLGEEMAEIAAVLGSRE